MKKISANSNKNHINLVETKKGEPVNILVMGVDVGTLGDLSKDNSQRTDTIILLNYDPKTKAINIISIPRDTLIYMNGKKRKINEAHAFGVVSGPGNGVRYLTAEVEELLDINVNYYGKVNYSGFIELINAIGGVDMKINNTMKYDDASQNLHIDFKKGETVHLNGQKAMEFFRWRKNNTFDPKNDGDIGRIKNQQLFIGKVLEKIKSPSIITKLAGIMQVIPKYAETNMTPYEILKYGFIFKDTNSSNIKMSMLHGTSKYIDKISYFVYEKKKNLELNKILHPVGIATKLDKHVTLDKNNLNLQVLNCTPQTGLASNYSAAIGKNGYAKVETGNGVHLLKSKIITYEVDGKYDSIIKTEFGINNIEKVSEKKGTFDIIIMLGEDYKVK
ncbi:LCP family protein [Clostridium tagluense]|uniref:LCP family protein n=1 Tax=Clostridium tagluense TaxID=360422 RepID=UPI001CF33896|nr:LCP family protein [Clostridium tagluense]MCB2338570.1 LCP family protein [Clostridium tagluense]